MQELLKFLKRKEQMCMNPNLYKKNLEKGIEMVLLDVRTREEYDDRHIAGAHLLPMNRIETDLQLIYPDKTKIYVVYCRSGVRSYNALLFMKQLGYLSVLDMGGIINWPFAVVKNR